jgi:cytidine deaminase
MPHSRISSDLPLTSSELLAEARDAARRAYCKYSAFSVGAAVIADGRLFTGCNIENASYGLSICAERVAIFAAVAAGCRRLEMLAVTCPDAAGLSASERMPCGACRQVIAEFATDDLPVIIDGVGEMTLSDLLPTPFRLGDMAGE